MKTRNCLLILSIIIIPISFAVFHILQEGLPSANPINSQHLEKVVIPEVKKFVEETKSNKNSVKKTILIPLPDEGFDAAETALPWKIFKDYYGFNVLFTTETGKKANTDHISLEGNGLDSIMSVIFKLFPFIHSKDIRELYYEMEKDDNYINPITWNDLDLNKVDAVWIPGGHAQGMKQLLEAQVIQNKLASYWEENKPVSAVCHGVILLARTKDKNGRSILYNRKTTSVTNFMERLAQLVTTWRMGNYYRTYDELTEDEVKRSVYNVDKIELANELNKNKMLYDAGPIVLGKLSDPLIEGFIVEDNNYISGRWPGDVPLLAHRLAYKLLNK